MREQTPELEVFQISLFFQTKEDKQFKLICYLILLSPRNSSRSNCARDFVPKEAKVASHGAQSCN